MTVETGLAIDDAARASRAALLLERLTERQRQVLSAMIDGLLNKQIAANLGIDEKTVKMHRAGALRRLGSVNSAEAIRIGVEASFAVSSADPRRSFFRS
jgi:FixJ family two-component response regulator